eukprot:TRINITY_DN425_c1_g1_i3.p1 TRINITY_DN425_c1_g1~~TRINITY_DN425_c1_g1_i3.p1  ORF type:complete len:472 (+),score=75.94 TRINITY_DN425_c1_g1_i3:107-1522(+)
MFRFLCHRLSLVIFPTVVLHFWTCQCLDQEGEDTPELDEEEFENLAYELVRMRFNMAARDEAFACMAERCPDLYAACSKGKHSDCMYTFGEALTSNECDIAKFRDNITKEQYVALLGCYQQRCPARPTYAHFPGKFSPAEVTEILSLPAEARKEAETAKIKKIEEFRSFGYETGARNDNLFSNKGGHTATFVHRVVNRKLPNLINTLKTLALEADRKHGWGIAAAGYGLPERLKVRNIEVLDYDTVISMKKEETSELESEKENAQTNIHRWLDISRDRGCADLRPSKNEWKPDPDRKEEVSNVADLEACKERCIRSLSGWCAAIDWREEEKKCILFNRPCENPLAVGARSLSLILERPQLGMHSDQESLLSVSVQLRESSEYEGGRFFQRVQCSNESEAPVASIGDVMVWPSMVEHGVRPVLKGRRQVLVLEFWEYCAGDPSKREVGSPGAEGLSSDCTSDHPEIVFREDL